MKSEHFTFPMDQLMAIEVRINNKHSLDQLVKNFQYQDTKSLSENLNCLAIDLIDFLKLQGRVKTSFQQYFVEKNIPIEVNFKPLKSQQVFNIIQQWVSLHTQSSTIMQKLYSNNHRNILFKRVLFQQKQVIDDYFQTLSEKTMLRGVDLYQLLVDILSPYHLYEYNQDSQNFFQKVNSLNSFLSIVGRFIHSQKRISVGISALDIEYIRRFQFDRLIQYWQQQNSQLILLSQKRKNHIEKGTQTVNGASTCQIIIQTDKISLSLSQIINQTINGLNKLTPLCDNPQELQIIQRMYSLLRKQKIAVLQIHQHLDQKLQKNSQKTLKKTSNTQFTFINNSNNKPQQMLASLIDQLNQNNQTIGSSIQHQQLTIQQANSRIIQPKPSKNAINQILRSIYHLYFSTGDGIYQMQKCLSDLGINSKIAHKTTSHLLSSKSKLNRRHIYYPQFEGIIQQIMKQDSDLNIKVLQQFLQMKQNTIPTPSNRHRHYSGGYDRYFRYL